VAWLDIADDTATCVFSCRAFGAVDSSFFKLHYVRDVTYTEDALRHNACDDTRPSNSSISAS
jgi:hypothetical protein